MLHLISLAIVNVIVLCLSAACWTRFQPLLPLGLDSRAAWLGAGDATGVLARRRQLLKVGLHHRWHRVHAQVPTVFLLYNDVINEMEDRGGGAKFNEQYSKVHCML